MADLRERKKHLFEICRDAVDALACAPASDASSVDRAFAADAAAAQQHEPIAEARRIADLMDRQEQRPPARRVGAQAAAMSRRLAQVEAVERLVDEQQRAAASAGRCASSARFRWPFDSVPIGLSSSGPRSSRSHDLVAQLALRPPKNPMREIERPAHRLRRPRRDAVGHVEQHAERSRAPTDRPSARERAAVERQHARQAFEQRGLARAVGTDEAEHLARAHLEADIRQRRDSAESLGDSLTSISIVASMRRSSTTSPYRNAIVAGAWNGVVPKIETSS